LTALLIAVVSLLGWSAVLMHVGGTIADGVAPLDRSLVSPISKLGTTADLGSCVTAPLDVGTASAVYCNDWNGIVDADGVIEVVSLHALHDSSVVDPFRGILPMGLTWGDTVDDVVALLGEPNRITDIYGTPTLVYMYHYPPFGSLELRFTGGDRLKGINACLER
jgi:hypothetical protein